MTTKLILVTVPDRKAADSISRTLVEENLAACVNIIPGVRSVYRWEGTLHDEEELLLVIKSITERIPALEKKILEIHPYDTPEVVVLSPEHVQSRYAAWVKACTATT